MRKSIPIFIAAFILLLPVTVLAADLTGTWQCNDGGRYYLRQFGSELWWYGEQNPDHPAWSNIAHGTVEGNVIKLRWTDVPKGRIMNHGHLRLEIESPGRFVAKEKSGGFGGSVWTRR
jgi:hypothetical protein